MKFLKTIRRDFRRLFRLAPSFNRLARRKAFQLSGKEMEVIGFHPSGRGFFLQLAESVPYNHKTLMWVDHLVELKGGRIRVQYRPTPEEKLITMYGHFAYRAEPTAYLAVAD